MAEESNFLSANSESPERYRKRSPPLSHSEKNDGKGGGRTQKGYGWAFGPNQQTK